MIFYLVSDELGVVGAYTRKSFALDYGRSLGHDFEITKLDLPINVETVTRLLEGTGGYCKSVQTTTYKVKDRS